MRAAAAVGVRGVAVFAAGAAAAAGRGEGFTADDAATRDFVAAVAVAAGGRGAAAGFVVAATFAGGAAGTAARADDTGVRRGGFDELRIFNVGTTVGLVAGGGEAARGVGALAGPRADGGAALRAVAGADCTEHEKHVHAVTKEI